MIMANQTPNYGLHQWEPSDDFLRTDFNTDLQKIDTALGQKAEQSRLEEVDSIAQSKCRVVVGSYTGTGSYQNFDLGAPAAAVMIIDAFYTVCTTKSRGSNNSITINGNGFYILNSDNDTVNINRNGTLYQYIALLG